MVKRAEFYGLGVILLVGVILIGLGAAERPSTHVAITDGDSGAAVVDNSTRALANLDMWTCQAYGGNSYVISKIATGVGDGQVLCLTVETPSTSTWLYTRFEASGSLAYTVRIYQAATVGVDGIPIIPRNRHGNSDNQSAAVCRTGDTFSNKGTLIWEQYVGSGLGVRVGAAEQVRGEFVLRQGCTYLFELESDVANNILSAAMGWYEHARLD